MSSPYKFYAVIRFLGLAASFAAALAHGQSTVGWATYNGSDFLFNYPPEWSISSNSTKTSIFLTKGDMELGVSTTASFGTDVNAALKAVQTSVSQFAASNGYALSSDPFVPDTANANVAVHMYLQAVNRTPLEWWAEARVESNTLFIIQLVTSSDEFFTSEVAVAWPVARSVRSLQGVTVVGGWHAMVAGNSSVPTQERYQVALVFNGDQTYTYDVTQLNSPTWRVHVSGTYTSNPAPQNNDGYPLVVRMTPTTVTQTGVSNLHLESTYLAVSGLPYAESGMVDEFLANLETDGSLDLVRQGNPYVKFQKDSPVVAGGPFRFVPVNPCRVVDTRSSSTTFGDRFSSGETRELPVPQGSCGIPSTAKAYSLNVTAVPVKRLDYITVWPTGGAKPFVSTLNSYDGRIKANAVIVQAGQNGAVSLFSTDPTDIILDINGYFVPASDSTALAFYPLTPCRISDTRNATGPLGGPSLGDKQSRTIPIVGGACGVPANAEAFSLNLTAVPRGPLDYVTVWPAGKPQPNVSTVNSPTGSPIANAAIVPVGTNGSINVYVNQTSDVIVDINGYFAPVASGALSFYGLPPCRIWDTRETGTKQPLMGQASVPVVSSNCGIPSSAQAFVLNATVVPANSLNYLSLWADGVSRPSVSTLNSWDASITSNMAIVPTKNGSVSVFTSDSTHTILDASGYFAP